MSDTATAMCTRCQMAPRPGGQRWCASCRNLAKREARAARQERSPVRPSFNPENGGPDAENGEQPSGWALGIADRVVQAPDAGPSKRRRPGRQVPADWPQRFLEFYARHGVRWRSAKYGGISYDTLVRAEQADSAFAQQVENARQSYLDRHALNLNRLAFKKDNVVASIVALKAGRPAEYVEKAMTVTAHFTAELPVEDGRQLLHAMLGQHGGATFPMLERGQTQLTDMLEGGPGAAAD